MNNAQKTIVRLQFATLVAYAQANVSDETVGGFRPGQEEQEWQSIEDCLTAKAVNPTSQMGDTWSLAVLGFKSPSWLLGIQAK